MNVLNNKLLLASPLIAMLVLTVFVLTLYPSATMKPVSMPVAIVNLDEGAALPNGSELKAGEQLAGQMKQASEADAGGEPSPVKWVSLESAELAKSGLDNREYYAALIIPADFSAKQVSLRSPEPSQPELEVLVNQGMNATAAGMITGTVNGMIGQMNGAIGAGLVQELEAGGVMLKPSQAAIVAAPIKAQIVNVNETGPSAARGNAPISLFQPIWMASIAAAAIGTLAAGKAGRTVASRSGNLTNKLMQAGVGAVAAVLSGYLVTWLADRFLELGVPSVADMGLFISLAIFAFYLMISAVLSWTGIRGIVLFVLLLFFGAPLLSLPPEFMNGFYRDFVHAWLPMRFMVDGLRELFFFGDGFEWNASTAALVWIGTGGLIVLLLSALKPERASSVTEKTTAAG
ncbi:MAG: hypothetical protein K0Q63_3219 [Paenibacillus sp.]|jgi:YhgE/Pip-like protein|nr:hypothetical protein [Paenibacillus sp.]